MKGIGQKAERKDIQGLIANGYEAMDCARFIFLKVNDCVGARAWLKSTVDEVATAADPKPHENKPGTRLNLALTWKGLQAMGIPGESILGFPREFVAGMYRPEAARILGDTGQSALDQWEFGRPEDPIHILVLLYAHTQTGLDDLAGKTCDAGLRDGSLQLLYKLNLVRDHNDIREPFGFRDLISQPPVKDLTDEPPQQKAELVETGEFVLGYKNEFGYLTSVPAIDSGKHPEAGLVTHRDNLNGQTAFGLHGSYLVFRKLSQNVRAFWEFVDSQSKDSSGYVDQSKRELFAARLVGRWRSGAPLVLAPDRDNPALGADSRANNDFLYRPTESEGLSCPIGAHIRRANPRDSLPSSPARALEMSRRHRIIRRGRKYTESAPESSADNPQDQDEGIYFIAINADLSRQFEFIQQTWINNPTFGGLDNDKDPITGDNEDKGGGEFTIQTHGADRHVKGLMRFVTVKGGGYFFLPGIRALRFLANYTPVKQAQTLAPAAVQADAAPNSR